MKPKYFLVYFSTYDYRWHLYTYFSNKKDFPVLVKALKADPDVDGDREQMYPRMVTDYAPHRASNGSSRVLSRRALTSSAALCYS